MSKIITTKNSTSAVTDGVAELYTGYGICATCETPQRSSYILIADVAPYKVEFKVICEGCGEKVNEAYDMKELPYGVNILFNSTGIDTWSNRMVFVNNNAHVKVFREKREILSFKCENSHVDSMNTLTDRMIEIVNQAFLALYHENPEGDMSAICFTREALLSAKADGILEILIEDETGYSRIAKQNIEYTEIQDVPIEELSGNGKYADECVEYTVYPTEIKGEQYPAEIKRKLVELKLLKEENE